MIERVIFGIDEGLGNIIQCEPAIATLRRAGLKVFVTKTGNWPRIWEVLENRVDGFIAVDDIKAADHFIASAQWRRGNPPCTVSRIPYQPINEIELNFLAANSWYQKNFNKNLRSPGIPTLSVKWGHPKMGTNKYLAINPARSLVPRAWNAKLYKHWPGMINALAKFQPVAVVGTSHDVLEGVEFGDQIIDKRMDGKSPLDHARFLAEECFALLTTEGGFGFLGGAVQLTTFIMWGPNRLYRNVPTGRIVTLFHGTCQECLIVDEWNSRFPPCPHKNECMEFTAEEVQSAIDKIFLIHSVPKPE